MKKPARRPPPRRAAARTLEVSRWQEAVDALARSEEKYRQVVENANEAILVVQDGRVRYANPQCARLSGYTLAELDGRPFLQFVHADDAPTVLSNYLKRTRGETVESSYEFRIIDKAGFTRWAHINAVAMEWEGRPATLNFLADVTERHALQENLARSFAEREVILKTAPVGISFASNRRHRWVNDAFAAMLGYDKSELVGQSSLMHFDSRESWEAFGAEAYPVLAAGRTYVTERLMKRKDGSRFWCEVTGNAVDPADLTRGSIWINVDVTERKRAEEEIRRALEQERELNELKSRFVAMTSHEFRTPLATILSSAELLEHYGARLPPEEQKDLFQSVRAAVERMTKMLDNVLIIGRAEAQMPDLIVCDITMPEMDGFGVLFSLRENVTTAQIPFIFLTASTRTYDREWGVQLGANDYITKPFKLEQLLEAIRKRLPA